MQQYKFEYFAQTRVTLGQVHEAFDLSGSVATAHLTSLQAEQVPHIVSRQRFFIMRRRVCIPPSSKLQVEVRSKIKALDEVKLVLDHKAEKAADR
jgi:hypothetical protein